LLDKLHRRFEKEARAGTAAPAKQVALS